MHITSARLAVLVVATGFVLLSPALYGDSGGPEEGARGYSEVTFFVA